ncbi:MAG: glycosyltransferase family 2 protein [Candidatus Eisenbacteria bacterium]|uniref:Glycosyltransferase family 2 protein n=1 Tax=Eiseniibacteriota bacterium TaxID=2212470 RepID=A0A948RVJ0_UNCEI|nr:glycosyltransferase family 2 protein [Candidatus Eisenbacteria bacterium]MBU1948406.1 glycosyltransferase family 2 protein [Candidatus Eisenbacteria bacterium]MBU2691296.1 glycosyltransferase family 2 protein [Candidatus Eisenbacteria bacterium]
METGTGNPLVSTIVPVYNGEPFIREALDSILAQDYESQEIIVVNDGSTDGTCKIIESYPHLTVIHQSNKGVSSARNAGLEKSHGELIAFLDSDDRWTPEKLRLQVAFLQQNQEIDYVCAMARHLLAPGTPWPAWLKKELLESPQIAYSPCTLLAWKKTFERVGPFNPELRTGEDTDWFARANDLGIRGGVVHEVLMVRRIHDRNISAPSEQSNRHLLKILQASIKRKRELAEKEKNS